MSQSIGHNKYVVDQISVYEKRSERYTATAELANLSFTAHIYRKFLLKNLRYGGSTLELACGSGIWTKDLARMSSIVYAIDSSVSMLNTADTTCKGIENIKFINSNILDYSSYGKFDSIFSAFWISHVPTSYWINFWAWVFDSMVKGGTALFIDSYPESNSWSVVNGIGRVSCNRIKNDYSKLYSINRVNKQRGVSIKCIFPSRKTYALIASKN